MQKCLQIKYLSQVSTGKKIRLLQVLKKDSFKIQFWYYIQELGSHEGKIGEISCNFYDCNLPLLNIPIDLALWLNGAKLIYYN